MISISEALQQIDETVEPLPAEPTPIEEAHGRVLAYALRATSAVPAFPQSAMDGYGLRAGDIADASPESPVRLTVVGEVAAGPSEKLPRIGKSEAVRIFTGAPVPESVDAVVRQEKVRREGDSVLVDQTVRQGRDVRPVGEELEAGELLGHPGERLGSGDIGRASMAGVDEVRARRRPEVAVFVTGNEVRPVGSDLRPGELYDANGPLLKSGLREFGVDCRARRLADDPSEVAATLDQALETFDLVVTTGGVSVGDYDFVVSEADHVGLREVFWKVRQKPGKPVWFGERDGTPLLGLPGNPGAVFVGMHVYLRRILDCLEAVAEPGPDWRPGRLTSPVGRKSSRAILAGANRRVDEEGVVRLEPETGHQSHRLTRLGGADALMWIPEGDGAVAEGEAVRWI